MDDAMLNVVTGVLVGPWSLAAGLFVILWLVSAVLQLRDRR